MEQNPERAFERFAVVVRVEVDRPDGGVLVGHTRNLSRGGLCVELADPLEAGSDVQLRVALIFEDDQKCDHLELPLHVVWCRPLEYGHQIGGQFGALSADQLEYLDVFVTFLEAVPWSEPGQEPETEIEQEA